jgi:hypothetical protein
MEKKKIILASVLSVLAVVIVALVAMSQRPQDPMKQFSSQQIAEFDALVKQQKDIFNRAGGKWESMSAEDKAQFLKNHWGDEGTARKTWAAYTLEKSSGTAGGSSEAEIARAAYGGGG